MKTRMIVVLTMLVLIGMVGCKKKAENLPGEEVAAAITTYAPLPTFKEVFRVLDQLQVKDISAAIPTTLYKTKQEEVRNAFSLGLLTADATLAAKGRNKARLGEISSQMMNLTTLIGLESEVNQMGADIKALIEKEKWDDLEQALDVHKKRVEDKLWDSESYDNYTLMLMGGWVEAANRVAWLLKQNYSAEKTTVLSQKGTFNSLIGNLKQIKAEHIVNQPEFKEALSLVEQVKAIIDSDKDKTYTQAQLDELIKLTEQVKATFQK
jgi:outer membrane murein-binding lipoprotein Lpp